MSYLNMSTGLSTTVKKATRMTTLSLPVCWPTSVGPWTSSERSISWGRRHMQQDKHPLFTDYCTWDGGRQLPTFKGYTVDARLMEFRRSIPNERLEFVPFDSETGVKLLNRLMKHIAEEYPESTHLQYLTASG